ncbi:probable protein phosphatase 2C 50 [Ananas comosus]|uniref:protein-serine/threonine phosphatase n=2 Tax=Ananas comosus TaxID=4615 RepID=A0A199W7X3_ANACO|nr:probable protein phosphatase 2C 50 [Ananas comosus]OAY85419.1 putative protein phosphatase 2C 6 [Ananas comosus]
MEEMSPVIALPSIMVRKSLVCDDPRKITCIKSDAMAVVAATPLCTHVPCDMPAMCSTNCLKSASHSLSMYESNMILPSVVEPVIRESRVVERGGYRSVFFMDCVARWGCSSICGEAKEMEDSYAAMPQFYDIPLWMLTSQPCVDGVDASSYRLPAHFFGVYDGHGGAKVANYCHDRIHAALVKELNNVNKGLGGTSEVDIKKQWERAFIDCFQRVDDEVGGKAIHEGPSEPLAPDTMGSTAVVAVVCSSHIIVANCGDSRVVLCRGKQVVPLSSDHKPNREDEQARIEAEGGTVINWQGFRVSGILAMSRSIGDGYFKPYVIPVPEVTITPRAKEDECLILASDGLWDVMSNEEASELARKRILLWHKKNGTTPSSDQNGEFTDPAAQAAADFLAKVALQKGSKDNVTVIVVDLKSKRKSMSKT